MMTHYRGMIRGLCSVTGSFGLGLGNAGLLMRFKPAPARESALREWLMEKELPGLPSQAGLASAHLLEAALAPPVTNEQRIRGQDTTMHWALLVTGYSTGKVASLAEREFSKEALEKRGAAGRAAGIYRMEYSLTVRSSRA